MNFKLCKIIPDSLNTTDLTGYLINHSRAYTTSYNNIDINKFIKEAI